MSWRCLFCNQVGTPATQQHAPYNATDAGNSYDFVVMRRTCPNPECQRVHVTLVMRGIENREVQVLPKSRARHEYTKTVPPLIFADYDEACAIEDLSPKASAALARRALQAVLKDYYGRSEHKLFEAIKNLQGHVDSTLWKALDAMRSWGNIGAHPDDQIVDIEPVIVRRLINVLEVVFDESYVARARRDALLNEVGQSI